MAKESTEKMKRQPTKWEKIIANDVTGKEPQNSSCSSWI